MNALPVRLFHASLTGIVIGTICSLAVLQLEQDLFASPTDGTTSGTTSGTGSGESSGDIPPPTDPPVSPDPNDLDGDGIPNVWEIQFHHDPNVAKDAGADFDNDGLTAREEYQLHVRTGGSAGNPLGQWYSETVPVPPEFADGWFYPVDINDNGDILVSGSLVHDGVWQYKSFIITPDDAWTEITPVGGNTGGYLWVSDFNDKGEVVGGRYSEDWSTYESFIWDSETGYRPFSYMGRPAEPYKINNYGDWIGTAEDPDTGEMRPAYVVDGINQHSSDDWWTYLWYSDINDFGEAMGSYYNSLTQHNNTLLAYGSWVFDTGLLGSVPAFDPDTYSWSWSSAMNAYGEFAGTSSGLLENQWSYLGYHFDGEFNEINFSGADLQYMSPESLNSSNTVVGYAGDGSGIWGAFIYRDGVGMFIQQLISGFGPSFNSKINNHGQIISTNNFGEIVLITPDQDQDGDGISDDWEDFHGLDKTFSPDAFVDTDNDGTSNLGEFLLRSDPNAVPVLDADGNEIDTRPGIDTDGDGIPNVWEWENGLDYQNAGDALQDFDRDGYTNLQEYRLNTDPRGAPAYRIREIGPFPGSTSVSMSPITLGNGASTNSFAAFVGDNLTDSVFFAAQPTGSVNGGRRPAAWSISRTESEGSFALYPSHGTQYTNLVAQSPGGSALAYTSGSPSIFRYWASATAVPISLSGATTSHNIKYLSNARFSPSGNYLVGTRTTQSTNTQELVVWKMPASATQTFIPVKLIPPSGVVISQSATAYVNDHGYIAATATVNGQNRPVLWKINDTGSAASASTLPVLTGGTWAKAIGISNQSAPVIAGTSTMTGGQQRATVWKGNGTTFIPSNLGTLAGGNYSTILAITPGGLIAGTFNGLIGGTLKNQLFIASFDTDSSSWKLQAQGEPGANVSFRSLTDSGEMLGTTNQSSPEYKQIPTLWRFGRAHSLESALPRSSGYTLDSITAINPNGTLLATTWKNGARTTVLLTPDRDTDGDGLPDAFENQNGFNAFARQTSSTDSDSDSLTDLEEFRNGTDPRNPDSDSDGMRDGWEVSWGLLPLDPTDAALDPDNDHVTNFRESQVGTTPTGIYKVKTRLTDTEWMNPYVTATDDRGRIIHTGQYQDSFDTDEDGFWIETSSQDYSALAPTDSSEAGTPIPLPPYSYWYRYNSDWTQYSYTSEYPSFWPDPASGSINGAMQRYSQDYDGVEYLSDESYFLIPDAANHLDPDTWISWETVENNLRPSTFDNSYFDDYGDWVENIQTTPGVMDGADMLNPYADAVSSSGTRRIHRSNMGECFVLNERGEFVAKLPASVNWQQINNQGQALALTNRYAPSTNGVPAYYAQEFQLVQYGEVSTLAIPHTPGVTTQYSLQRFSDDGKALLTRSVINAQGSYAYENHLFDIHTGSLTRVKQPGLGYESMVSLSNLNSRLLGSGSKPFQITPDGTCIRLDALRIKESSSDAPLPFSSLYSKPLTPIHISSDGRITLTTPNASGQTTILQIVPNNDSDTDTMADDWEKSFARMLLDLGKSPEEWGDLYAELISGNLNSSTDYTGDGISAADFAATFNIPSSQQPVDGILMKGEYRRNILAWGLHVPASTTTPARNEGLFYYQNLGYYGAAIPVTQLYQLQPAYMTYRIGSNPWEKSTGSLEGFSTFSQENLGTHTNFSGSNWQARARLVAQEPGNLDRSRTYLKVTRRLPLASYYVSAPETVKVEAKEITIQAKHLASDWVELIPPVVDGYEYKVSLMQMEIVAHKRGTLNKPGAQIPRGTGEFGYETVMMENGNSQSADDSSGRDCDLTGDLTDYRKANDNDLVKVVLKYPTNTKIDGASLKLLHVGMQVDATKATPEEAVATSGVSRLKFYKADGKLISDPTFDLQIPDLGSPPADRYLSKIIADGEVTIFIEGADRFGDLPHSQIARLGGALLKWEFQKGDAKAAEKLLVYRGGFIRFMQPAGAPGTVGSFEFWDGKGRVRHDWGGKGNEFKKDDTDMGNILASWKAKSGKTSGKDYNFRATKTVKGNGHAPPGWWLLSNTAGSLNGGQLDTNEGNGDGKVITQGWYRRWKQDDETDPIKRYTVPYHYNASNSHDRSIGEPRGIGFKYNIVPITAKDPQPPYVGTEPEVRDIPESQNRNEIQVHPDGMCNDPNMGGTAGCIGIQTYIGCKQVDKILSTYHCLKVKVQLKSK